MDQPLSVLMIEDHPVIIDVYKNALFLLNEKSKHLTFTYDEAHSCDEALFKLRQSSKTEPYDFIFMDINLPSSKACDIKSGEDLGSTIKALFPNAKIMVCTGHTENQRINSILDSLTPLSFLVKADVDFNEICKAIESVVEGNPFYSKTVLTFLRKKISTNVTIDKIDRRLLYELSIGTKTKDLPDILPMSMAGIERRKRRLKNSFNIPKKNDQYLINAAKKNGFL